MSLPTFAVARSVPRALLPAVVAASLFLLYLPVFVHAAGVWSSDSEFSFGFFLAPLAIALLWWRRAALHDARGAGTNLGLIPMVVGLLLLLASVQTDTHALAGASLLPTLVGTAAFVYGASAARLIIFPVALLAVSLSLYRGLFNAVGFALQQLTARWSADLAGLLGVPVHRAGVDLFAGRVHLVVAQACSGMDSLAALLCLAALVVGLGAASLPRRLTLITLVLPIIVAANVIRVTLVLVLSAGLGLPAAEAPLHQALDAGVFLSETLLLGLAIIALRCLPRIPARPSSSS